MLTALFAGLIHNVQHDWLGKHAHDNVAETHFLSFNAPYFHDAYHAHEEASFHTNGNNPEKSELERDCLLGDLTAISCHGVYVQKPDFIIARTIRANTVRRSFETRFLPPVRAPPYAS